MVASKTQLQTQTTTRRGPSTALIKAREAANSISKRFSTKVKTLKTDLEEAKTVSVIDAAVYSGCSFGGAAVTGLARGLGNRFEIDRKYVDAATVVAGLALTIAGAVTNLTPVIFIGAAMTAPATADFFERLAEGGEEEGADQ